MKRTVISGLYLLLLSAAFANEKTMNGIDYSKYREFDKKWKLVTVRFRKDTEEMRFTYANPLAYKALLAGKTDFPDGAVFGKLGVRTGHDPLFESSLVPHGARRYQLMVRNTKKYKEQNGWGYALFDERGIPFPEDHKTQVEACASCHNVAEERGYVFSQIINTQPRKLQKTENKLTFKMIPREQLPEAIRKLVPEHFNFVRVLQGELVKSIFQGTLEEIRPTLSKEAFESRQPAVLLSVDESRFSLVYPENLGSFCDEKNGFFMKSIYTNVDKDKKYSELSYCHSSGQAAL